LRSILAITIVAAIFTQTISKVIIIINFQLNQEYIAKNLCEQKEKEDNCCQGSCHLKKKLAEEDKKTESTSNAGKIKFEKNEYCGSRVNLGLYNSENDRIPLQHLSQLLTGVPSKLLRPPRNISVTV
jgi:hypothetical protein